MNDFIKSSKWICSRKTVPHASQWHNTSSENFNQLMYSFHNTQQTTWCLACRIHFHAVPSLKIILALFTNNTHFYLDFKVIHHKCVEFLYTTCADKIIEFSIHAKPWICCQECNCMTILCLHFPIRNKCWIFRIVTKKYIFSLNYPLKYFPGSRRYLKWLKLMLI